MGRSILAISLAHQKIAEPDVLFRKIEDEEIAREIEKLQGSIQPKKDIPMEPLKPTISYDQFKAVDLRVGVIVEAEKVPKSKKLFQLLVDVGFEKRTVVSGISHCYEKEQLIGKKVIVVVNMAPVKIMGVESQGMVLVAGEGELELPMIEKLSPGSVVM